MDENVKIKVSDYTRDKDSEFAKFSVTYSAKKIDNSTISHQIISTLKEEDNIIIEINSSLLNLSENESKIFISKFIASLEKMKIEYRNKTILMNAKRTILSLRLESKKIKGIELFAYIPNEIWMNHEFIKIIPNVGVRYYLPKLHTQNNLDDFVSLDEEEKLEQCRMVIFDHILLGSMGINTSIFKKDDIIMLLNK
ncbi:MAG: hypothetical protein ACYDG2_15730 [Ruminiclostridium sp.]